MANGSVYPDRDDVNQALETLRAGGLILYPTDTIWGIGCDATNADAVEKIFRLKGRSQSKSVILLLHSDHQLASYVDDIPEVAYQLIEATDKPLTIVYSRAKNLPENVCAADGSVGIRVVNHPFCRQLLERFRKPIVSTSANISGELSPAIFDEIADRIKDGVDYIVRYGQDNTNPGKASVVIKVDPGGKFTFLRK